MIAWSHSEEGEDVTFSYLLNSIDVNNKIKGDGYYGLREYNRPCGINCAQCETFNGYDGKDPRRAKPLFLALIPLFSFMGLFSKTSRTRRRVLKRIFRIPKDEPLCRGCRNHNGKTPLMTEGTLCPIHECATAKELYKCSLCSDFPCEHLLPKAFMAGIVSHNLKITNCCLIKKHGLPFSLFYFIAEYGNY